MKLNLAVTLLPYGLVNSLNYYFMLQIVILSYYLPFNGTSYQLAGPANYEIVYSFTANIMEKIRKLVRKNKDHEPIYKN